MMKTIWKSRIPLSFLTLAERIRQLGKLPLSGYSFAAAEFEPHKSPFFIIGCGRSGNTLLRSMLCAGGKVVIPPESYVIPRVIRRFSVYAYLPWDIVASIVVSEFESYKEFYTWGINLANAHQKARSLPVSRRNLANIIDIVYKEYELQLGKTNLRWGDKTPINTIYVDKILKVFPTAQYIHIVRDPRDVVCSYVNAGLYKSHAEAAQFWNLCVDKSAWLSNKLEQNQFYQLRYEDLVTRPECVLKPLCKFLGVGYKDEMLEYWKITNDLGDVDVHSHHKNVSRPISTESVGKWKNILDRVKQQEVERIIGDRIKHYGYEK